jgi:hypothetical protein
VSMERFRASYERASYERIRYPPRYIPSSSEEGGVVE